MPQLSRPQILLWLVLIALALYMIVPAQAQTFSVLHNFTGGADGALPIAGLTLDGAGNFYGTTQYGGRGFGAVFKLARKGSGWSVTPLYSFQGGNDGSAPFARVVFGPDGELYGTTQTGGGGPCQGYQGPGCGTVFKLRPPSTNCRSTICPWLETVLYRFGGGSDASYPFSSVTFDQAGNIYGSTEQGGAYGAGAVYELVHSSGGWTESILHSFNGNDGLLPYSEVVFDAAGNLYGTTAEGSPYGAGLVYELSPSGSGWVEKVLYNFAGTTDGAGPIGGVILDAAGNLYGTTVAGGWGCCGTVFELTPTSGYWNLHQLYNLTGASAGPDATLTMDAAGNLYGTAAADPSGSGSVFKLTKSGASWALTYLYNFQGDKGGIWPYDRVVLDANGNLYGTTNQGGTGQGCNGGCGTIWEITP